MKDHGKNTRITVKRLKLSARTWTCTRPTGLGLGVSGLGLGLELGLADLTATLVLVHARIKVTFRQSSVITFQIALFRMDTD